MTIIDAGGKPLPDGHPFKGMQNTLGAKRPVSSSGTAPQPPAPPPEREPAQSAEQQSTA